MKTSKIQRREFTSAVRNRIRIVMAIDGVTGKQLAKAAKLSYPTFNNVMNSSVVEPKYSHIFKIAEMLGFEFEAIVGTKSLFARRIAKRIMAT